MKSHVYICFLALMVIAATGYCDDFLRNLPDEGLRQLLTPERFKGQDAVIILKEQSLNIERAEYEYRGTTLKGPHISHTNVILVKLFNEAAVSRYGTLIYNYRESLGDDIPNLFEARARVLKEDGSIHVMGEDGTRIVVAREDGHGRPLARKAIVKVPDLATGDVLQLEYTFTENQ